MYSMTISGDVFYDDTQIDDVGYQILDFKLTIEDNKAGSLSLVIPPSNRKYNSFKPTGIISRPVIKVCAKTDVIWIGRATSVKMDFWNRANVFCEGAMAWLDDALYEGLARQEVYDTTAVAGSKVRGILSGYWSHVDTKYAIGQGACTVQIDDEAYWDSSGTTMYAPAQSPDTSRTCLQRLQDVLNKYGGHFQVVDGFVVGDLDWYKDLWGTGTSGSYVQTVNFGENLLDYVKSFSTDDIFTVIRPYGALMDNAPKTEATATPLINSVSGQLDNGWRFDTSGEKVGTTNQYMYVSQKFTVKRGKKYYYSGFMYGNSCMFVVRSSQNITYEIKSNYGGETYSSTQIKQYNKVEIPIPEFALAGGYTIEVSFYKNNQYETDQGVSFLDYSNLYEVDADTSVDADQYRVKLPSETWSLGNLVSTYGWIEKRVDFPTINHVNGLMDATLKYESAVLASPFDLDSLSINFVDMAYYTGSTDPLKLYDGVRVISEPHGVDVVMYVTKIELSINPANSKITLGVSKEKGISALVGG